MSGLEWLLRQRLEDPDRRRTESGDSLVELAAALTIFALVMIMVVVIVSVVTDTSSRGLKQGVSTSAVERGILTLDPYVRGAISPTNAVSASVGQVSSGGGAAPLTLSTTSPCWGKGDPDPTAENNTADWPDGAASGGQNSETGIIVAHDYDMEFCALPPNSQDATPHVYQIEMVCAANAPLSGACTVEVIDYGTANFEASCIPSGSPTSCGDYNPTNPTSSPANGTVIATVPNVWCDLWCQGVVASEGGNYACSSFIAGLAGLDTVPTSATEPCSSTTVASTTPPLFNYFPSSATSTPGTTTGSLNSTAGVMDLSSTSAAQLMFTGIASVDLDLTVLSDPTDHAKTTAGTPGSRVTEQIDLAGVTG